MRIVTIKRRKHVQDVEVLITLQLTALTPTRRAEHVGKLVICRVRVDLLEQRSPRQREAVRRAREARVQAQSKRVEIEDRTPHRAHHRRTIFLVSRTLDHPAHLRWLKGLTARASCML